MNLYIFSKSSNAGVFGIGTYMDSKPLADSLKAVFDCKIVLVVHYLDSVMTLYAICMQMKKKTISNYYIYD